MNDIDHAIRAMLHERAGDIRTLPPWLVHFEAPTEKGARTLAGGQGAASGRRRTVWLVAAAVAAIAAVAAASIAIRSGLGHRNGPPTHSPSPAPFVITFHAAGVTLTSLSCSNATDCVAVGEKGRGSVGFALRGGAWHTSPGLARREPLTALSCTSSGSCMTAGPGIALWRASTNSAWTPVSLPRLPGGAVAKIDVDCSSSTACVAVGTYHTGPSGVRAGTQMPIAFSWNGRSWSRMPNPPVQSASQLSLGVSCWAADGCRVATIRDQRDVITSSLLGWDGSHWSVDSPFSARSSHDLFFGLDCTAETSCVYIGEKGSGGFGAEVLKGTKWSWHPLAGPASSHDMLGGVTCLSASSCLYVGGTTGTHGDAPDVETWNGTTWSSRSAAVGSFPNPRTPAEPTPPTRTYGGGACVATGPCMFTGNQSGSRGQIAFIEYSPRPA